MADIQKHILKFDSIIRLKRFDENEMLRTKRDAIVSKLERRFEAWRAEGTDVPTFKSFNQGSYQIGTGIQPIEGDYDIDVGIRFECASAKYPDAVSLKILVADALDGHTSTPVDVRRSCVTVHYKLDAEVAYHVDLAVYTLDDPNATQPALMLAKGKRNSDGENRKWEKSDPLGLLDWISSRFADEDDRAQFYRVIRALKRWKTVQFGVVGNDAPTGIALTVAAANWFKPAVQRSAVAATVSPDDLDAMHTFVSGLIDRFAIARVVDGRTLYRLTLNAPVEPHDDLFARMTEVQMTNFRERLVSLLEALRFATETADPVTACEKMQKHFGSDFPVPDKDDTGQSRRRAVSSAGVSA